MQVYPVTPTNFHKLEFLKSIKCILYCHGHTAHTEGGVGLHTVCHTSREYSFCAYHFTNKLHIKEKIFDTVS